MTVTGPTTRVHIVGVAGAGMSGLARLLVESGAKVSGSDLRESVVLEELRTLGVTVAVGHDARHVEGAHVVLWSPAVPDDNVELVRARRDGATMLTRSMILAELAQLRPVVGLTGTHGKTTGRSCASSARIIDLVSIVAPSRRARTSSTLSSGTAGDHRTTWAPST